MANERRSNNSACQSTHGLTLDLLEKLLGDRISAMETLFNEREERNKERFDSAKESVTVAMASAEKAIVKAEAATEKRFENVNEFRQTLSDQAGTFVARNEYNVQHQSVQEKLEAVSGIQNALAQRISAVELIAKTKSEGLSQTGAAVLGFFTIMSALTGVSAIIIAIVRHP